MDRSGAMPRSAWLEVRDERVELLFSTPARIDGGELSAECPAFPPGTRGWVRLREEGEPPRAPEPDEVDELPTEPMFVSADVG